MVIVVCLPLLAASCGDDEATSDPTPATTPDTTTPGWVAAPLAPKGVCVSPLGEILIAYDDGPHVSVVVPKGDDNSLTGAMADDNALLTTVFASGREDPAFRAFHGSAERPVVTLVGPDGVGGRACGRLVRLMCSLSPGRWGRRSRDRYRRESRSGAGGRPHLDGMASRAHRYGRGQRLQPGASVRAGARLDHERHLAANRPRADDDGGLFIDAFTGGWLARGYVGALALDQCASEGVTVRTWSPAIVLRSGPHASVLTADHARLEDTGALSVGLYERCDGLPGTEHTSFRPQ
jgi:hypothetical protein